jgi:hypothetical protein
LVGHYQLNGYIAQALLENGWLGQASSALGYWEFRTYEAASSR